ncbi:hypothetical protein Dimus_002754, partial [Dionaea muscipula]
MGKRGRPRKVVVSGRGTIQHSPGLIVEDLGVRETPKVSKERSMDSLLVDEREEIRDN